jgi:L-cysteine S-thiosulfotransferase
VIRARLALLGVLAACAGTAYAQPVPARSGSEFQSAQTRALEADEFANPGVLWVTQGEGLWNAKRGSENKSCADCHRVLDMKGVAARLPAHSPAARRVLNLDATINQCVTGKQKAPALPMESSELLALSAYVAHQSKGLPLNVDVTGPAHDTYQHGKALYFQRIGQMNLACTHCHDRNWGKTLLAEPISQGQPNGWPAYRLEWQGLGSLQRRLRACFYGVRAEQPAYGSDDLIALELYLAKRAGGLKVEVPGVRR